MRSKGIALGEASIDAVLAGCLDGGKKFASRVRRHLDGVRVQRHGAALPQIDLLIALSVVLAHLGQDVRVFGKESGDAGVKNGGQACLPLAITICLPLD